MAGTIPLQKGDLMYAKPGDLHGIAQYRHGTFAFSGREMDQSGQRERCAMNVSNLPRIAVTMGDPAGIGPEICLHLLNDMSLASTCVPLVFGDAGVLRRVADHLKLPFTIPMVSHAIWSSSSANSMGPMVIDLACIDAATVVPGQVDARCGEAAFRYVIAGIEAALAGRVDAVATAPLNKEAMHAAGHKYPATPKSSRNGCRPNGPA